MVDDEGPTAMARVGQLLPVDRSDPLTGWGNEALEDLHVALLDAVDQVRRVVHLQRAAEGPQLGLASTRQLLEEIKARGEMEHYNNSGYGQLGADMASGAANLIEMLPGSMLEYRTVDTKPDLRPARWWERSRS